MAKIVIKEDSKMISIPIKRDWYADAFDQADAETRKKMIMGMLCTNHTGKMSGIISLSTSPLVNPACAARAKNPNMICAKCYSMNLNKMRKTLREKLERNSSMLARCEFHDSDIPFINAAYVRFEAFGDLLNVNHAKNLIIIARNNKHARFVLWTKNPNYMALAIAELGKPKNLDVIYSNPYINSDPRRMANLIKLDMCGHNYDFIDGVFSVYSKDHIENHHTNINCGSRKCAECRRCYEIKKNRGAVENALGITFINEKLK